MLIVVDDLCTCIVTFICDTSRVFVIPTMNSGLRGSYFASVNSILKDGMITPELSTRKLNESSMIANSGVVVAMVFAGLIFTAIVAFLICKYYEDINKCMKKSTKMKKKRDARDYKVGCIL